MNRRSVIRCILGLAAAPKILAEIDFKPPIITPKVEWTTFEGIIPALLKNTKPIEYVANDWCLTDLNEMIANYYKDAI